MSSSVFAHPVLSGLLSDEAVAGHFSLDAELNAMLDVEEALAIACEAEELVPEGTADALKLAGDRFSPDWTRLKTATARDGVIVPDLVTQLRAAIGVPFAEHIHYGATSQDIVDTALVRRLVRLIDHFAKRLDDLGSTLNTLAARDGNVPLMLHTRMQAAMAGKARDKIVAWQRPLADLARQLPDLRSRVGVIQLGGAVGDRRAWGDKAEGVADRFARALQLTDPGHAWHTDRTRIAEMGEWATRLTGALGKIGVDVCLLAQSEVKAVTVEGAGGSSSMPHKANPVLAEALVTLARFNATQIAGLHQALVHENERSGAAWTLEWMILPQILVAAGAALARAEELASAIKFVAPDIGQEA